MYRLIVLLFCTLCFGAKEVQNRISFAENRFTFDLEISSALPAQKLYELIASDSASVILRGSADSVEILPDRRIITIFRAFGYRAVTETRKIRRDDHRDVTITVESFSHNWSAVPQVKSGEGRYLVNDRPGGSSMIYRQEVLLDRKINWLTERLIHWQLHPLAEDLLKLIGDAEQRTVSKKRPK